MDSKLIVLHLATTDLGIGSSIGGLDERKTFQKAIYLAQVAGLDLGYRYGWYVLGPYCPELTRDYYALDGQREAVEKAARGRVLIDKARPAIERVKAMAQVPADVDLDRAAWLELLASYHYLRNQSRLDERGATEQLEAKKPQLVAALPRAQQALAAAGLVRDGASSSAD